MIILRQHNYSFGGGVIGGIAGNMIGGSIGSKIGSKFKKKASSTDIDNEKSAIEENKQFLKVLKSKGKLSYEDIGKLQDLESYGDISDILLNVAGVDDDVLYEENPKYLDHINSKKSKMIQESQRRLNEHENNLKNVSNINKGTYKDIGGTIGGTLGTIGGAILGHKYIKTE